MKDTKIICNIDNVAINQKPRGYEVGILVTRLKSPDRAKKITLERLSLAVTKGYSFTSAMLTGRTANHFVSQQIFVIDIDNDNETEKQIDVQDAVKILKDNNLDYAFIYYTFSDTAEKRKFRIVFCCDAIITDRNESKRMTKILQSLFVQCDKACINLDRLYYATDKTDIIGDFKTFDRLDLILLEKAEQIEAIKTLNLYKNDEKFDLIQTVTDFNLLEYIQTLQVCNIKLKGEWVRVNPCPLCGHKGDFFIKNGIYKCHSSSNNTSGNIINFLQQKNGFSKAQATDYLKYQILKRDRQADIKAFKNANCRK